MKTRYFLFGLSLGAVLGGLAVFCLHRLIEEPVHLHISGTVRADTASHEDSHLDNRIYLDEPTYLQDRIYLGSENGDINGLYEFVDQPVSVYGRINMSYLESGDPFVEVSTKSITRVKQP